MPLVKVCMILLCIVFASFSQLSRYRTCDACPKEGSLALGHRISQSQVVPMTNNVINVITGLWARYPLMMTAEPDVNASSKQEDSGKPDIDCLFVLPIIPSSFLTFISVLSFLIS